MITVPEFTPTQLVAKEADWYMETPTYSEIVGTFGEVLVSENYGSYQGDSLFLIRRPEGIGILTFGWGSCSGCDSLEAVQNQSDLDRLQSDLKSNIKWFASVADAIAYLDGGGLTDSYLDDDLVASFKAAVAMVAL
ncbi:hypothetical protein ASC66_01085 [Leifsonia sp. Root4]|uniref:hypothetical protein n=1 Tax=Leifsonia sp. Root4 TaxID=1736525 RepID=UPI0006F7A6EF|nr:hypothetical protein [Leifsonia sp. Root4]KQW07623.1 hypothetical protein ASC66_01085 [Leifsonia sp. Root4]